MNRTRADDQARILFEGVAPERLDELAELWARYQPTFSLVDEITHYGPLVIHAGAYVRVEFNHRVMRAFWLGSFIAWEAYAAAQKAFTDKGFDAAAFDPARLEGMLEVFDTMIAADDSASVVLPDGVPEPGVYPARRDGDETLAPAELATFATGWALLHEVCHLMRQQRGESPPFDADAALQHAEELICDQFAAHVLLDRVDDYAKENGVDVERVVRKRQLGVLIALFVMALLDRNGHIATQTHPALQTRIDALSAVMNLDPVSVPLVVSTLAFFGLARVRPHHLVVRIAGRP